MTYLYRNDGSQCLTALSLLSDIIASYGSSQYREYYSLTECATQQHVLMKLDASRHTELIELDAADSRCFRNRATCNITNIFILICILRHIVSVISLSVCRDGNLKEFQSDGRLSV